jgi:hypothetical protein
VDPKGETLHARVLVHMLTVNLAMSLPSVLA